MERISHETRIKIIERVKGKGGLIEEAGSVTKFAESIKVSRDTVNNWLRERQDIRVNDLVMISKKYNAFRTDRSKKT